MEFVIEAIGYVRGGRSEAIDDDWGDSRSSIELNAERFGPDALAGLDGFSHVEVVFVFDKVPPDEVERGARHPRGRADWPRTGIFAQRGRNRPNRLGVTVCEVVGVEGAVVHLRGLDAIDGTPVVDLKPVMREFLPRGEVRQPAWVAELMAEYW